jgi:hypothetical protein
MASKVVVDISDNSARAAVISKLTAAAAANAPTPLAAWRVPTDSSPHPTPVIGIGNVWQQLNSLRVMAQYTRILGDMCAEHPFLQGQPTTCVHGLEWFSRLAGPLHAPDERVCESLNRTLDTYRNKQAGKVMHMAQAAFEVNSRLACPDRSMMQLLLWYHFPLSSEFEVDICNHMLSRPDITYSKWLEEFPKWRELGLYYPMILAGMYMPGQGHWLPVEAHRTQLATSFAHCLNALADPEEDHQLPLRELESDWESDDTGTAHVLASTIDRLAVLMRVKSNGRPGSFGLADALASFPRSFGPDGASMHESNYHAWLGLKSAVESAFPPSLLCTPLVRPRKHTWGFPRLTLRVGQGGEVFFAETDLQCVAPDTQACEAPAAVHYYTPAFAGECLMGQTSHRVQDVLWRLGEIVTSPDVALCMLHPAIAAASMQGMPPPNHAEHTAGCKNRHATLSRMLSLASTPKHKADYAELTGRLDAAVPPVELREFPDTQAVLMWRLDIPSRAIVYLGEEAAVQPALESQHHLSKALVHSKVPQSPIGGICAAPARADDVAVRGCLSTFAASGKLASHPSNTVLVKADEAEEDDGDSYMGGRQVVPISCTTLAESVACLALRPASKTTVCQLGGSCAWKEGGIDPRYAERQQADNGVRFRDWVALHAGKGGTQQSRLASHVVEFDSIYTTKMPWIQQPDGSVRWVRVASTAKPESKTLQGKTLRQAVESRFLHDLRMLPVRGELGAGARVERSNTELYSGSDCSVAVAYAPTGQSRLELMAFEVDP